MTTAAPDLSIRRTPPAGGFNATLLALEVRRMLRNKRTLIFTLVFPCMFFLIFGLQGDFTNMPAGRGNVTGYVMVSMARGGAAGVGHRGRPAERRRRRPHPPAGGCSPGRCARASPTSCATETPGGAA